MTEPSTTLVNKSEESLELEPRAPNPEAHSQMRNCESVINQFEPPGTLENGETQIHNVIDTNLPLYTHQVTAVPEPTEGQLLSEEQDNKEVQCFGDTKQKPEEPDRVERGQEEQTQNAMKVEPQLALTEASGQTGPGFRMSQNDVDDGQMLIEQRQPLVKGKDDKGLEGNGDKAEKMEESKSSQEQVQRVTNEIPTLPSHHVAVVLEFEERKLMLQEEDKKEIGLHQNINEKGEESELIRESQEEKTQSNTHEILPQQHSDKTKEELELREFLLKDENNKEMPCCGDIIEKLGGCNRIECSCGKQVCWVCLAYFDEKDDCYSHLIDEHGGYFEENEIENMIQSGAKKLLCCGNLAFNEGDNHVVCPICRKHSCWLCLEVFTIGRDCDKHLHNTHTDN